MLEKYRPTGKSEPELDYWEWRYLWGLCQGDELSTLHRQIIERLSALGSNNWGVARSPDGRWLAAANACGTIETWNWPARRAVASLALPFQWVGSIWFSRTGQFLLATSTTADEPFSTYLKIWRTRDWTEVPAAPGHYSMIVGADVTPHDRLLAVARADGTVQLSRFPSCQPLASLKNSEGYFAARFSPHGRLLALGGMDGRWSYGMS